MAQTETQPQPEIKRTADEILAAHDLIISVLEDKVKLTRLYTVDRARLFASVNVLCWLLGHGHSRVFDFELDELIRKRDRKLAKMAREDAKLASEEDAVEASQ
jgi:hypothetical protein